MNAFTRTLRNLALILWLALLVSCRSVTPPPGATETPPAEATPAAGDTPTPPPAVTPAANGGDVVEAESHRDGVFAIDPAGGRQSLPAPDQIFLQAGSGIDVDENGRAVVRFSDLLTVEVLRDGELSITELDINDQAAVVSVLQNGGAFLNDFDAPAEIERRFTIETEFATITATGTRFLVAREAGSPLEWVVGLDAAANDLEVTANGVTKEVPSGTARWVAPIGEPSPGIEADMGDLSSWVSNVQDGFQVEEVGEVLWAPADLVVGTRTLSAIPAIGEPFTLGTPVLLTLAQPSAGGGYRLEDCNGDGQLDIAMQDGILQMDFRQVLARTRSLDVTVLNRSFAGSGGLRVLDPARAALDSRPLSVAAGEGEVLSLRTAAPFHYAELVLANGCFLGFSLTPPESGGAPGAPRPAVATWQPATPTPTPTPTRTPTPTPTPEPTLYGRPEIQGSMVAWPVGGVDGYDVGINIDGEPGDWADLDGLLPLASGGAWTPFDEIVFDRNCSYRGESFGPDLTARVAFAYDTKILYVAFEVLDETYAYYTGGDERFFLGDAPQLLLDLDLPGDLDDTEDSLDDIQLDFHPGLRSPGFQPRVALWRLHRQPPTSSLFQGALVSAAPILVNDARGYFLEAAIPWSLLGPAPEPELVLGLAASVSDNDSPGENVQECMISTTPRRDWQDPTTWGTLLLARP